MDGWIFPLTKVIILDVLVLLVFTDCLLLKREYLIYFCFLRIGVVFFSNAFYISFRIWNVLRSIKNHFFILIYTSYYLKSITWPRETAESFNPQREAKAAGNGADWSRFYDHMVNITYNNWATKQICGK